MTRVAGVMGAALLACSLSACGYHPLYATRGGDVDVAGQLAAIAIPEPDVRLEQEVRNALMSSLQNSGGVGTYTLTLAAKGTAGNVVSNPSPGMYRYNYALTVSYKLLRTSGGDVLTSGTSKSFVSYDRFKQPVAALGTQADAEARAARDVADDIRTRLAAYFSSHTPQQ